MQRGEIPWRAGPMTASLDSMQVTGKKSGRGSPHWFGIATRRVLGSEEECEPARHEFLTFCSCVSVWSREFREQLGRGLRVKSSARCDSVHSNGRTLLPCRARPQLDVSEASCGVYFKPQLYVPPEVPRRDPGVRLPRRLRLPAHPGFP